MKNKVLIGIIAALFILLIVGEVLASPKIQFQSQSFFPNLLPHLITWVLLSVWICFGWIVWKKNTSLFHDQIEPELAERLLRRLKVSMLSGGILLLTAFVILFLGIIALTNTLEAEEALTLVAWSLGLLCFISIISSMVIFLKGRRKPT
jgi:hypothetical protein